MKKYFMIFVLIFALSFLFCQNFSLEKISTTGYNNPFFTFNIWNSFECSFFAITDKLDVEYNNYVLEKKDGFPFLCLEKAQQYANKKLYKNGNVHFFVDLNPFLSLKL